MPLKQKEKPVEVNTATFYDDYAKQTFKTTEGRVRAKIDRTSPYYMSKTKFVAILKDIHVGIMALLINEGFEWVLPNLLGRVVVLKRKPNTWQDNGRFWTSYPTDFKKSVEIGKRVLNFNEHTDGYVMKICYKRTYCRIPYKSLFKFKPSRIFKRDLAHAILTKPEIDFMENKNKRYVKR